MSTCEERWVPVVIKHHGAAFERCVFKNYEVNNSSVVRRVNRKVGLGGKRDYISLCGGGIVKQLTRYHICLVSFFPYDIPPNIEDYHVDHIDGNHSNNALGNLQWITKSEHSKKTYHQTKGTRKSQVEKAGKKVRVIDVMGTGRVELIGIIYNSTRCAARELGLRRSSISSSIIRGIWVNNQYKFEFAEQTHLPCEIFNVLEGDYQVSNKGRVMMKSGKITCGSNMSGNAKYRTVNIKLWGDIKRRQHYVHILVWRAFNGDIPEDMVVMHDDSYPTLDEEGRERNYLEDLSVGTYSENTQSYHDNRKDLKRVRCLDNDTIYFSGAEAAKELGLHGSHIHSVCKKKLKTTGGKRFEYV